MCWVDILGLVGWSVDRCQDSAAPWLCLAWSVGRLIVAKILRRRRFACDVFKSIGKIYNLGGPETVHWKKVIDYIAMASGKRKWTMPVPGGTIKMVADLFDRFAWFPITRDQLTMLMQGNAVSEQYFTEFNIMPKSFSAENLGYLKA